jgi:hypothetical protein
MQARILVVDSRQSSEEVGGRLVQAITVSGYAPAVIARLDERAVDSADGAAGAFVDLGCSLGAGAEIVRRLRARRPDLPIVPYTDAPRGAVGSEAALHGGALACDPGPVTRAMVALSRARSALQRAIEPATADTEAGGLDPDPLDLDGLLLRYREAHVLAALRRHPCEPARAAKLLDVPESTLRSWNDPRSDQRKFTLGVGDPVVAGALVPAAPWIEHAPALLVVDVRERPSLPIDPAELATRRGVVTWRLRREHDIIACVQRVAPLAALLFTGDAHACGFGFAAALRLTRELPELPFLLWTDAACARDSEPAAHLGLGRHRVRDAGLGDDLVAALLEVGMRSREFESAKAPHACSAETEAVFVGPTPGLYAAERELERAVVLRALEARGGSRVRAAEGLLLTPQSLWRRMKRLQIT